MRAWPVLFVSLALGLPGCVVEPVDLSGKGCPCAPGFRCDEGADRCVRDGAECDALVTVEGFRAAWATANVIRWEWEPAGDREDFVRYEIEIAERVEDLGTERARVVDADENPELGSFVLPRTGGADDVVTHSATFAHAAEATHVAQLLVTDRAFCTFRSAMAGISTTLDPPEEIVLFRDARPDPGFAVPSQLSVVDDGSGNFVTEHVPSRDAECVASGEGVCSQNLRWSGLSADATDISEGELANIAMLEIAVTNDSDLPSFYSRFWLALGDGRIFELEPFTIRNGPAPRVYQVPLRALVDGGAPLSLADLSAQPVTEVNVGGQWSRCGPDESPECFMGRVLLDEMRIRY